MIKSILQEVDNDKNSDLLQFAYNLYRLHARNNFVQQVIEQPEDVSDQYIIAPEEVSGIEQEDPKKDGSIETNLEIKSPQEVQQTLEVPQFTSKASFVNFFMPLYEKALSDRNIPVEYAKYLVGQIALESGWGKRPAGWREGIISNNYMGEKHIGDPEDGVTIVTHEEDASGKRYKTTDVFKKFASVQEMVNFHVWKFTRGHWTKYNIFDPNDIDGFADRVHAAGYATGKKYNTTLNSFISEVKNIATDPNQNTNQNTNTDIVLDGDINNPGKIVISKETMTLKVYDKNGKIIYNFPVAVGKGIGNKKASGDMKTPEGTFSVSEILPAWDWGHDFKDGKGIIPHAYGPWFIRLNTGVHKGIGIHGTHDPSSIGKRVSEGCIRLRNEDLEKLKPLVSLKMPVIIESSKQDMFVDSKQIDWKAKPARTIPKSKVVINGVDVGYMKPVIDVLNKHGIKYRLTSGYRPFSTNKLSWHKNGYAIDIVAPTIMNNETFLRQFIGNKALLDDLYQLGYGILNEYVPEMMKRTKATGVHLHIGPDDWSRRNHMQFYNKNMPFYSKWW